MMGKTYLKSILKLAVAVVAIGGLSNAWAAGCTQDAPGAKVVALVDGTSGCANLSNGGSTNTWTGCRMDPGSGVTSCTTSGFTAHSTIINGKVTWWIDGGSPNTAPTTKADAVVVGGGNGGSNCGYFYKDDAVTGSGMGYLKTNGSYQNVTYVDVCTNGKDETQVVSQSLQTCPDDVQGAMNNSNFGDFALVGSIHDGDKVGLCVNSAVHVQECINEERKGQTGADPTGLPLCSAGPKGDGATDVNFKRGLTFSMIKTGNDSSVYVCLPPTYTFAGGSSCAWLTY
jgi:hypothetical protein